MKNNSFLSRVIFLILLIVMGGLEANVLLPQQINFNAIKDNNGHHIKYSYVSDEDERGLMWSASLGALFRYDGSRLIRYSVTLPHHDGELKSPIITDIYFHQVDSLYLATNMGLLHFNPMTEQFSHFIGQDSNLNPTTGIIRPIRRIVVRNNHQLWLARKDSISLFDTSSNQFVEHIYLSHFIKSDGISVMNISQHQSISFKNHSVSIRNQSFPLRNQSFSLRNQSD
ncbi:MAG: hypothetical protein HRU22_15545 [Gammaproteobacteria bacterium]|nr:hypothetical protein [Gammaproteobacteria bacterium]